MESGALDSGSMTNTALTAVRKHGVTVVGMLIVGALILGASGLMPGVSALLIAIIAGAIARNLRVLPRHLTPSLNIVSKRLLRLGIVLLGFKLSLPSLAVIGAEGVVTLIVTVIATYVGSLAIGAALKVPRSSRMLIATGFAICGASAVAAMSSIVDPDGKREEETAQAVALVTIFGTIALFGLPFLVPVFGLSDLQAGIWIGASVHEVAQVVAAGAMVSTAALAVATLAKLGRVVLLAPLIAVASAIEQRRSSAGRTQRPPILPLFVAGFLAAVLVRTFVPMPGELLSGLDVTSTLLLTAAMLGLGYGVDLRKLVKTGWQPFVLGAASTVLAATVALVTLAAAGA